MYEEARIDPDPGDTGSTHHLLGGGPIVRQKSVARPIAWVATNQLNGDILHFSKADFWHIDVVAIENVPDSF